jgi:PHD/YefM family antitoxin component YafN of YafNO toxin-antitoxin module
MTVTNLKVAGRQFVVIPASDFRRLQSKAARLDGLAAADAADAAKVRRAVARYRAGKSKAIPLAKVKNELGIGG